MWPEGEPQPLVATLNALDGAITNNMAIVPTTNGSITAFLTNHKKASPGLAPGAKVGDVSENLGTGQKSSSQVLQRIELHAGQWQTELHVVPCDSVPGHHVFNNFRTFPRSVSLRFIPKTLVC
jgi:hypothetical protein